VHLPAEKPTDRREDDRLGGAEQVHPALPNGVVAAGGEQHGHHECREADQQADDDAELPGPLRTAPPACPLMFGLRGSPIRHQGTACATSADAVFALCLGADGCGVFGDELALLLVPFALAGVR
jgi:hypothetical protein